MNNRTKMEKHVTRKVACNAEKRHQCKECGKQFKLKIYLTRHAHNFHKTPQLSYKFGCLKCEEVLSNEKSLIAHYKNVHPSVKKFDYEEVSQ